MSPCLSLSAPHILSLRLSLSITFPFPSLYFLSSFLYPIFQCSSLCPPPLLPQPSDVSIDVKLISACGILPREGGSTLCISLPHWQTQILALFIFHPLHYFCPWFPPFSDNSHCQSSYVSALGWCRWGKQMPIRGAELSDGSLSNDNDDE